VEGVEGSVDMECVLRIRFGYGQIVPWVRRLETQIAAIAGPDSLWLTTPVALAGRDLAHTATFTVTGGERVPFVLGWLPSHQQQHDPVDAPQALADTRRFWQNWSARCGPR